MGRTVKDVIVVLLAVALTVAALSWILEELLPGRWPRWISVAGGVVAGLAVWGFRRRTGTPRARDLAP